MRRYTFLTRVEVTTHPGTTARYDTQHRIEILHRSRPPFGVTVAERFGAMPSLLTPPPVVDQAKLRLCFPAIL